MSEIKIVQPRLLSWKLVISIAVTVIVLFGTVAGYAAIRSGSTKDHNTAVALAEVHALIEETHELIAEIKVQAQELKAKDVADEANIVRFAENQKRMLDFQAAESAQVRRLLNFVRTHPGSPIPASLLTPIQVPKLLAITKESPKSSRKGAKKHKGHG